MPNQIKGEEIELQVDIQVILPHQDVVDCENTTNIVEQLEFPSYKINHRYLIIRTFFYILATSFNNGIIQGEVVSVGFILAEKFGWSIDGSAVVNIGYI